MREIKFRAWSPTKKMMGEVLELSFEPRQAKIKFSDHVSVTNVFELVQYTGLKDNTKSRKEIYENDIVHFLDYDTDINHRNKPGYDDEDEGIAQVKFGHTANGGKSYTHAWYLEIIESPKYKPFGYFRGIEQTFLEVIGTIYEKKP